MKYPDIDIQIRYPNKLLNADIPSVARPDTQVLQSRASRQFEL